MIKAADGCDIVYHVAAKAGIWGPYDEYYRTNVIGTKNVINACLANGIKKLVYTSSPSVVFDGTDMEGVDESVPYPDHFEAYYPETKAEAERLILKANSDKLATVALRPHLIWGPEDNHLVPRIIEKGKKGTLRKIGNKQCLVDTIYVDNAAEAHIMAADKLDIGSSVAGKTYFISQEEPKPLWDVVNQILEAGGVAPVERSISPGLAYGIGWALEKIYSAFSIKGEPRMTRFLAGELSTSHWFDISAAKSDFGYKATVSYEDGMSRLKEWLRKKQG
jgi:nucleoside-diphosphate-sugar epimerase